MTATMAACSPTAIARGIRDAAFVVHRRGEVDLHGQGIVVAEDIAGGRLVGQEGVEPPAKLFLTLPVRQVYPEIVGGRQPCRTDPCRMIQPVSRRRELWSRTNSLW